MSAYELMGYVVWKERFYFKALAYICLKPILEVSAVCNQYRIIWQFNFMSVINYSSVSTGDVSKAVEGGVYNEKQRREI